MPVGNKEVALLEWMTGAVDCAYLSDLKQAERRQALLRALKDAPRDVWTVKAWMDFAFYITGKPAVGGNEHEVRDLLDRWLRSQ